MRRGSEPRTRAGRGIVRLARVRADVRQRNVLDAVVRHAIRTEGSQGGEFHDVSGGYEIRGEYEHTPHPVGFGVPDYYSRDTPGMPR